MRTLKIILIMLIVSVASDCTFISNRDTYIVSLVDSQNAVPEQARVDTSIANLKLSFETFRSENLGPSFKLPNIELLSAPTQFESKDCRKFFMPGFLKRPQLSKGFADTLKQDTDKAVRVMADHIRELNQYIDTYQARLSSEYRTYVDDCNFTQSANKVYK